MFLVFGIIGPVWVKRPAIPLITLLHASFAVFIGIPSFAIVAIAVATYAMLPLNLVGRSVSEVRDYLYGQVISRSNV